MSYEVELSSAFKREAKRLTKKYPSLKTELEILFKSLEIEPFQGTPLGNNIFKIRLAIASKRKGKSGGARVITFVKVIETSVILVTLYNKSEQSTITDQSIKELLKGYI